MITTNSLHDPDNQRGIQYADGGVTGAERVYYPNPDKIKRYHEEWEGVTGYLNELEMDCD